MKIKILLYLSFLASTVSSAQMKPRWQEINTEADLIPIAQLSYKDGYQIEIDQDQETGEITIAESGPYGPMFESDENNETALQLFLKFTPDNVAIPQVLIDDHLNVADDLPLYYKHYPNTEDLAKIIEQRPVTQNKIILDKLTPPDFAYRNQVKASGSWCGGSYNSDYDPGTNTTWHIKFNKSPQQDWAHLFRTKSKRRAAKSEINTCWLPSGSSMTVKVGYKLFGGYKFQKEVKVYRNAWGRVRVWNRSKKTRISLLDRSCKVTSSYNCDGSIEVNYLWKGRLKSGWGKP